MEASVIDTLRFADRLKEAGFEPPRAEGLARALGDELGDRVLTANDRKAFDVRIDGLEARFDAKFDGLEAKFDAKFDGLEAKFDAKFDGLEAKFDGLKAEFDGSASRFDAQHESLKVRLDSLGTNFKLLVTMFAIGFSVVIGLGMYNVVAA